MCNKVNETIWPLDWELLGIGLGTIGHWIGNSLVIGLRTIGHWIGNSLVIGLGTIGHWIGKTLGIGLGTLGHWIRNYWALDWELVCH